jgi:hypothetical protein
VVVGLVRAVRGAAISECGSTKVRPEKIGLGGCAVVARCVKIHPTTQGAGMQQAVARMQGMPDSVRAAMVGIALIALALGAWMLTAGSAEHRVPVAPVSQAETTGGDPAPAEETTTSTVVSVADAGGEGSQSLDVTTDSSASAPSDDASAVATVEQSSTQTNGGTASTSASESTSEHYSSSTTSGENSTSVSVEVNKTTSNEVVTTGPDQGSGASSNVVSHVSSHVGSTTP